jgi:hypothetical protein
VNVCAEAPVCAGRNTGWDVGPRGVATGIGIEADRLVLLELDRCKVKQPLLVSNVR